MIEDDEAARLCRHEFLPNGNYELWSCRKCHTEFSRAEASILTTLYRVEDLLKEGKT